MVFISAMSALFASWCAYMLPKDPIDRVAWANPKQKVRVLIGASVIVGVITGLVSKVYLVAAASAIIPLLVYFLSEHHEVISGLDKGSTDRNLKRIHRGIVRRRS